ncbi:MAG: type II toxin-antitoxin system prevent-host-death family antitoxin [Deltaproteobacteria bacterium]|nr:type II toxin-antitoxin system prevent-host-death family antitoxin [Deltaproteobacteria bacterium]
MVRVNVAALKANLSKYLRLAKRGDSVVVVSHREEIARIGPVGASQATPFSWREFKAKNPSLHPKKKGTPAHLLIRAIRDEEG